MKSVIHSKGVRIEFTHKDEHDDFINFKSKNKIKMILNCEVFNNLPNAINVCVVDYCDYPKIMEFINKY